mgnify:CR=1 FL=1
MSDAEAIAVLEIDILLIFGTVAVWRLKRPKGEDSNGVGEAVALGLKRRNLALNREFVDAMSVFG